MTIGNINVKNKYVWITGVVIVVIILLLVINWIINSAFIDITVINSKTGEYKYSFLNQSGNKSNEVKTNKDNIKQLVGSGNYEVLTQQSDNSFFTIVKTNNFLSSIYIDATLKPQNYRTFVGNNPDQCMSYVNNVLVSYGCDSLLANARVHIPATATLPTYTSTTRGQGPAGYYEGIFDTKNGSFALSQIPQSSEFGQTHILNRLGDNFKAVDSINITKLNPSTRYFSKPFKNGFIAYDSRFSEIQYFPEVSDKSNNITGIIPDGSYSPISLDTQNESVLTSYAKKSQTIIYINTNNNIITINIDKPYSKIIYCGERYLCMKNNNKMDVYLLNNNKADFQYSVVNISDMLNLKSGFFFTNNDGVINFNLESRSGYLSYYFGDYKFNSIIATSSNLAYVLNVTNTKGNKVALLVDPAKENNNNIDKKILDLQNNQYIKALSIYGNYITIVPNIPQSSGKNFDQTKVNEINQKIQQSINSSNIDQKQYTINFTIK